MQIAKTLHTILVNAHKKNLKIKKIDLDPELEKIFGKHITP